jgi:hypothetical protein
VSGPDKVKRGGCYVALTARLKGSAPDQPAFNRDRLKAEKLIDSKVLEQLIRVQVDAGCSSTPDPQSMRVLIILSIRSPAFSVTMMVFVNHLLGSASPHEDGYRFGVERRIVRYVPRIGEKKLKLMWSRL